MKTVHKIQLIKFLLTGSLFIISLIAFWYNHFILGLALNVFAYVLKHNVKIIEQPAGIYILHLSTEQGHLHTKTNDFKVIEKLVLENTDLKFITLKYNNFSLYLQDFDRHILVSNLDKFKALTNG